VPSLVPVRFEGLGEIHDEFGIAVGDNPLRRREAVILLQHQKGTEGRWWRDFGVANHPETVIRDGCCPQHHESETRRSQSSP